MTGEHRPPSSPVPEDRHWADGDPFPAPVVWAFEALWDHLVIGDVPERSDAIFCFGSRDRRVVPVATALFRRGLAPFVLVTGGLDGESDVPEGDRMAAALVAGGVPADRVVVEREAGHTGENVMLGTAALREVVEPRRALLVSWPLAGRRCRATFAALEPDVATTSVPALARPGVRWAPTRRRIQLALAEVDRLERYGATGAVVPQPMPPPVRDAIELLRDVVGHDHLVGGTTRPGGLVHPL